MRHGVIRLLPRTDYNFSDLGANTSVTNVPLAQDVSLRSWGGGTLLVRVHAVTLSGGSSVRVDAKSVAPCAEEPASFFRGAVVGTVVIVEGSVTAPSLRRGRLAAGVGNALSLFLTVSKSSAGTLTFTISVDLVVQELSGGWTPAELGSKLRLWLDERDQVAVSGTYSDWGDQSPSGSQDFTQGTADNRPLVGSTVNDFPAPNFDGTNDSMAANALSNFVAAAAYHVFVVFRAHGIAGSNPTAYLNDAVMADGGAGWWGLYLKNNAGTYEAHGFHWDSTLREAVASPLNLNTDTLVEWSYDGSTLRCRIAGGTTATGAGSGNIGDLSNTVSVGIGPAGSVYFKGRIAAAIVCNESLSGVEVQNVRDFLASRYGVAA